MRKTGIVCFLAAYALLGCVDMRTIRPVHAKSFYQRGLDFLSDASYTKAQSDFTRCVEVADPVTEEYYASMCRFEKAFTYSLERKTQSALKEIEMLLSQVVSSKEPRILAENLRAKIIAKKDYQNATY